jgi:hypothetical protein
MKAILAWSATMILASGFILSGASAFADDDDAAPLTAPYCSASGLSGSVALAGAVTIGSYPQRFAGTTTGAPAVGVGPAGESQPGCTGGNAATANSPAQVYQVTINSTGTYSFHVTAPSSSAAWQTYLFLFGGGDCLDPINDIIACNGAGYGTAAVRGTRSDLTTNIFVPGTYYLAVTGAGGASGDYVVWMLNDADPFGVFNNDGTCGYLDSLDALYLATGVIWTTASGATETKNSADALGFFDLNPLQTLDDTVTPPSVFPIGDAALASFDSLDVLYLSMSLLTIPQGSAAGAGNCAAGCWDEAAGVCRTPPGTAGGAYDQTDIACGSGGASCTDCRGYPNSAVQQSFCYQGQCTSCPAACGSGQACSAYGDTHICSCILGSFCTSGCCDPVTDTCVLYSSMNDAECGRDNYECTACGEFPAGSTCAAESDGSGGVCVCTQAACAAAGGGCCDVHGCEAGTADSACGSGGRPCQNCTARGLSCENGACPCNATTCPTGCCYADTCYVNNATHCGTGGAICTNSCTTGNQSCTNGVCS